MFANLKNTTDVYVIELEPGVHLGNISYGEIFGLLENTTRDYFNNIITEREFYKKKQEIITTHVSNTIDDYIILKPSAEEQNRLRSLKEKRINVIVKEIGEQVNDKMIADVNYINAITSRTKIMAINEQGGKNIHKNQPHLSSSSETKEIINAIAETSKQDLENSKHLLEKKESDPILLSKRPKKKSAYDIENNPGIQDNPDCFFNKGKKSAVFLEPPANDTAPPTIQLKKAS